MKIIFKICLLLLPFFAKAQQVTILDTTLNNKWVTLDQWRYQKGDDKEWANPAFDDSSWKQFKFYNLNMPDGKQAIANRGEIVWFRTLLKVDSGLNKTVVLNISQYGASEIYLDGKLIHQLGKLSPETNQVIYNNSLTQILELPLLKGKNQLLAVRYQNAQYKFPIYFPTNGYLQILVSTLSNANSRDVKKNRLAFNRKFTNNYYITLGIAILMFIIFLSFFLFFPSEKINGYFASAIFFLIFYVIGVICIQDYESIKFWISFCYCTSILIFLLISLYCTYKIFNKQIDVFYKIIVFLVIVTISCFFLYDANIIAVIWAVLSMVATIRIALQSQKNNRVGSILFISSNIISIIFWSLSVLNSIGFIKLDLYEYIPSAFMLNPIVLSVYLGYAFGKRSQELRLNLERVQKLSKEKESILSSQNEMLEKQVQERTASLNQSIENLKSTQSQLIQSEKMASLGELTAGIAHEIQNPLNFVNNFSEVNKELLEELKAERLKPNAERKEDIENELIDDVISNEEKINHHGKRADAIVKGMLQHSRSSSGQKEPADINALCDEYLRLVYHGLRAKDKDFNASLETQFDTAIGMVNIQPQEMGRVVLNLINNAFYAVAERSSFAKASTDKNPYEPKVTVSTEKKDNTILISVKDNGTGIPQKVVDKIFQPFFTTKPTGQGTGLGLSLSYDIVKAHGGELKVETEEGSGSKFIIQLPFKSNG